MVLDGLSSGIARATLRLAIAALALAGATACGDDGATGDTALDGPGGSSSGATGTSTEAGSTSNDAGTTAGGGSGSCGVTDGVLLCSVAYP